MMKIWKIHRRVPVFAKGVIAGAMLVASFVAGSGFSNGRQPAGVVEGTGFRLVDANGNSRGSWTVRHGAAELLMSDAKGRTRLGIQVSDFPIIKLWGEKKENGVLLSQEEGKGSWVVLSDENGTGRIRLQAAKNLAKGDLIDADGHTRLNAVCDASGKFMLSVNDGDGKVAWGADSKPSPKDEKK